MSSNSASPVGSSTSRSGTEMPSIFAWRSRTIRSWFFGSYEMFPEPFAFSRPPMRCSRPGVPGTANWRASVSGSRAYGSKFSPALARVWSIGAYSVTSGMRHGSEPLAMAPSDRMMTGVR